MLSLPCWRFGLGVWAWCVGAALAAAADRPNILWITAEDMSPTLGSYGDATARTPHLDAFAKTAVRYTRAFAAAPVCAPSRATLITGVHANSLGNPHLRCEIPLPAGFKGYAGYLREAGYYTTNNVKTDYNLADERRHVGEWWNESSATAHWRGRAAGQPFLAVFNLMETHQSRTSVWPEERFEREIGRQLSAAERTDPATVAVPPFYPNTPAARQAMARYYDCVAAMDRKAGALLRELETAGLAEDTIVFFYSDHGMGMPRGKRLLHDSGMHVPLLIRFPRRWAHLAPGASGTTTDRLVSFVDFAPTVLSLAGVPIPAHFQGRAFLGKAAGPARTQVFGARDRVDEAIDTARSVRDARWLYIRNYRPELSWAPPEAFSDASAFRRELRAGAAVGELGTGPTAWLAPRRPVEELYDTAADPHQLRNLAAAPEQRATLERMRGALRAWLTEIRDVALVPEAEVERRTEGETPYGWARRPGAYPFERVLAAAERVGMPGAAMEQRRALGDAESAVRYWAAVGLAADEAGARVARAELTRALGDAAATVRIAAAGALLRSDVAESADAARAVLAREILGQDLNAALHAARVVELAGEAARGLRAQLRPRWELATSRAAASHLEFFLSMSLGAWLAQPEETSKGER